MCNVKVWNWSSISGLGEKATYPPKMEESSVAAKSAENSGKDDRTNERKDAEMGDREGGGRALSAQPPKRPRPSEEEGARAQDEVRSEPEALPTPPPAANERGPRANEPGETQRLYWATLRTLPEGAVERTSDRGCGTDRFGGYHSVCHDRKRWADYTVMYARSADHLSN